MVATYDIYNTQLGMYVGRNKTIRQIKQLFGDTVFEMLRNYSRVTYQHYQIEKAPERG